MKGEKGVSGTAGPKGTAGTKGAKGDMGVCDTKVFIISFLFFENFYIVNVTLALGSLCMFVD